MIFRIYHLGRTHSILGGYVFRKALDYLVDFIIEKLKGSQKPKSGNDDIEINISVKLK